MAGTTPTYGFPYPTASDTPAGHTQMQSLATAIEAKFVTNDASIATVTGAGSAYARGRVGSATSNVDTNITITEAVVLSCTFTAVAGRRYKFTMDYEYYQKTGTASANMSQKIRVIAGSTPTATGGTVVQAKYPNCRPTAFNTDAATMVGTWVAPTSGTYVTSFTVKIDSGTGGIAGGGTDHIFVLLVEDIGV